MFARSSTREHIEAIAGSRDERSLCDAFATAIGEFGFDKFTAWTICDLDDPPPGMVSIDRYPRSWMARYMEIDFLRVDPTHRLVMSRSRPFLWSDLARARLSPAEHAFMQEAADAGLAEGVSVPLHGRYARPRNVSMSGPGVEVSPRAIRSVQFMSTYFYEAARRLSLKGARDENSVYRLSTVEAECLLWASVGRTDWVTSAILGISESTVRRHIDGAKRKLGVPTRTQAVVQAVLTRQIVP